jgi:hypothetical protein
VELTSPATAVVLGFPLLMMFVMLGMNVVERRLTRSRPTLQLIPGGETSGPYPADQGADDAADPCGPARAGPDAPERDETPATGSSPAAQPRPAEAGPAGGELRPALHLITSAAHASRGRRARTARAAAKAADGSAGEARG